LEKKKIIIEMPKIGDFFLSKKIDEKFKNKFSTI